MDWDSLEDAVEVGALLVLGLAFHSDVAPLQESHQ